MRVMVAALLAVAAQSQQQPATRVEFEIVSVKPGDLADPTSSGHTTPGHLVLRNATLKTLLMNAFRVNEYQIAGGPKWIDSAKFNVDAKLPAGAPMSEAPLMMQAMLAGRFKLSAHRETRTLREYALVVAKGGPKFGKPDEGDHNGVVTSQSDIRITGYGRPISDLARMLVDAANAPVIDRTGLKGQYDFDLKFGPLLTTPRQGDDDLPSIFTVVQVQLGLKLQPIKGPVEVLVIDRAEMPTAN
jgi:uncharacterized protein (TIGR03435 family)